jgi:hypothetical protein
MKRLGIFQFIALVSVLSGCADFGGKSTTAAPMPTPATVPIKVYPPYAQPKDYVILGQVSGPSVKALEDAARKLGADAIIQSTYVDPVSGWSMANAIKLGK